MIRRNQRGLDSGKDSLEPIRGRYLNALEWSRIQAESFRRLRADRNGDGVGNGFIGVILQKRDQGQAGKLDRRHAAFVAGGGMILAERFMDRGLEIGHLDGRRELSLSVLEGRAVDSAGHRANDSAVDPQAVAADEFHGVFREGQTQLEIGERGLRRIGFGVDLDLNFVARLHFDCKNAGAELRCVDRYGGAPRFLVRNNQTCHTS